MTGPPSSAGIEALADDAWLVHLGNTIDAAANARVHALCARLRDQRLPWLRDLVPAYASLGVFFDPLRADADDVRDCLLRQLHGSTRDVADSPFGAAVEIPVTYGGEFGADLDAAAAELGLSAETLVQRHAATVYTVAMIGFAPGFPYLSGLDPALALPRLATPRPQVPAGSVAVGGSQTGIYPRASPGGWRLLGRTPLRLFDPSRAEPSVLAPGDRVRFRVIDTAEFARLAASQA